MQKSHKTEKRKKLRAWMRISLICSFPFRYDSFQATFRFLFYKDLTLPKMPPKSKFTWDSEKKAWLIEWHAGVREDLTGLQLRSVNSSYPDYSLTDTSQLNHFYNIQNDVAVPVENCHMCYCGSRKWMLSSRNVSPGLLPQTN
jgi:hypothetical protein